MALGDLKKTTEELVRAAAAVAMGDDRGITNEQLAEVLQDTLSLHPQVLNSKVEVVQETEEERAVREVMEAPERFTVHVQMVLSGDMPIIRGSYSLGEERVSVGPIPDED